MGVPTNAPVTFIHDANAVLAGELWRGNAYGRRNVAVVTLGTGLGFAISRNGRILCNPLGGPLLSIFGLSYDGSILEDYVSRRGILAIYKQLNSEADSNHLDVADIGEMAQKGDTISILTFETVGRILGETLKDILSDRKIECLLFGGQISRSFPYIQNPFQKALGHVESLSKIATVQNIDYAAFWGAVSTILQRNRTVYI